MGARRVNPKPAADELRRLAHAHGVATTYRNERRERVEVDSDVVVKVLGLLEIEAGTSADRRRELSRVAERARARTLPPTVAVRVGGQPHPMPGAVSVVAADGTQI